MFCPLQNRASTAAPSSPDLIIYLPFHIKPTVSLTSTPWMFKFNRLTWSHHPSNISYSIDSTDILRLQPPFLSLLYPLIVYMYINPPLPDLIIPVVLTLLALLHRRAHLLTLLRRCGRRGNGAARRLVAIAISLSLLFWLCFVFAWRPLVASQGVVSVGENYTNITSISNWTQSLRHLLYQSNNVDNILVQLRYAKHHLNGYCS